MTSALGILKWTPTQFWGASMYEYTAAMKGHLVSQGVDMTPGMSREEFLTLKAQDEARTKTNEKPNE
jgi:hypothetical protein